MSYYPPYSRLGGSQIVDFEGRLLADASPGPGERIVVASVDVSALRHEREARCGHSMLAHLRTEAYTIYKKHFYPRQTTENDERLSYEKNNELIDESKRLIAGEKGKRKAKMKKGQVPGRLKLARCFDCELSIFNFLSAFLWRG